MQIVMMVRRILILLLTGGGLIYSATYYVGPNGNNANPGTESQPWAAPGYGSRHIGVGDTLIIKAGTYHLSSYEEDIITPPSGTVEQFTTIKGEVGNRPILLGGNDLMTALDMSGCQYVKVENLEIASNSNLTGESRWFREAVSILDRPARHIILQDLYIHHLDEFGINIQDIDDLQVINSRIEYCGFGALGGPTGINGGWRNVTISGCSLSFSGHYYQGSNGSDRPYDRPDGFGIEPSDGPILIENTVAQHNYGDGLDSKAANTTIKNCIVSNNSCDGVKLWAAGSKIENTLIYGRGDGDGEVTPWSPIVVSSETAGARFEIINVTVDDALGGNYLMHVQYDYQDIPITLLMRNSIFSGRGPSSSIWVSDNTNLILEHNLFYFPQCTEVLHQGEDTSYTTSEIINIGTGNRYGDPLFNKTAWGTEGDYHLKAGSPAIDSGTINGALATDLDGSIRPAGSAIDIGAYEYGSGSSLTLPDVTQLYVATFNRAPDAAGLNYWVNSGLQLEQISKSFYEQPETQKEYPPGTTPGEYVTTVYNNLFNRDPDQAGLNYWAEEIESGNIDRSVFILAVINGAQNTDAIILMNKTTVGLAFANAGLNDVEDARDIMSGITDDPNTVTAALDKYGI